MPTRRATSLMRDSAGRARLADSSVKFFLLDTGPGFL
jgi:hypothetical protein